jgi:hypothetical protein
LLCLKVDCKEAERRPYKLNYIHTTEISHSKTSSSICFVILHCNIHKTVYINYVEIRSNHPGMEVLII